ncbi:titin-like isoform X2 [Selaginella moellendorffii]|uniref:titin-like isoform X2 n=1 Tax=Selaginella moellendorffii TaxID=88036 RepID=UPI000D1C6ABB|nr:titin-like isoform X2 [Selaginella moellendorffii]|eukprot:XP_024528739.1 titin-like isoform X2 [Selaginella moellendorffii]
MRGALDRRVLLKVRCYCTSPGRGRGRAAAAPPSKQSPLPAAPAPKSAPSSPGVGHGSGIAAPATAPVSSSGRGRGESPIAAARNATGQALQANVATSSPAAAIPQAKATAAKAAKAAIPAPVSSIIGVVTSGQSPPPSQAPADPSSEETPAYPPSKKPTSRLEASEAFGALIQSCVSRGLYYEIDYVHAAMQVAHIPTTMQTCQTLLNANIQLGNSQKMDNIYAEMREIRTGGQQKPEPSVQEKAQASETLAALISSWYNRGFYQEVGMAYRGMKAGHLPVSMQACRVVMDAYNQLGNYSAMDMVYSEMRALMTAATETPIAARQPATTVSAVPAQPVTRPPAVPSHGVGHGTPLQTPGMQHQIGQAPQYQQPQQAPATLNPQQPAAPPTQQWPQTSAYYPPNPYVNMQPVPQAPVGYHPQSQPSVYHPGYQQAYQGYPGYYQQAYPGYQTYPGYPPGYPGYQPAYPPGYQYPPPPYAPAAVPPPPPPQNVAIARPQQYPATQVATPAPQVPTSTGQAAPQTVGQAPRPKLELQPKALEFLQQSPELLKAAGDRATLMEGKAAASAVRPQTQVQGQPPQQFSQVPYQQVPMSVHSPAQFTAGVPQVRPAGHAQFQAPPQPVPIYPSGLPLRPGVVQRPIGQPPSTHVPEAPSAAKKLPPEVPAVKIEALKPPPPPPKPVETKKAAVVDTVSPKPARAKTDIKSQVEAKVAVAAKSKDVAASVPKPEKTEVKPKTPAAVAEESTPKLNLTPKKPSTVTEPPPKLDLQLKKPAEKKEEPPKLDLKLRKPPTVTEEPASAKLEAAPETKDEPGRAKLELKLKKPSVVPVRMKEETTPGAVKVQDEPAETEGSRPGVSKAAPLKLEVKLKKEKVAEAPTPEPPTVLHGLGRGKVVEEKSSDLPKPPPLRLDLKKPGSPKAVKETVKAAETETLSESEASDTEVDRLPSIRKFISPGRGKGVPLMDPVASLIGLHTPTDELLQEEEALESQQGEQDESLPALPFESRRGKGRGKVIDPTTVAAEVKRSKLKREEAAARAMAILEGGLGKSQMSAYLERRKKRFSDQFSLGDVTSKRTTEIRPGGGVKKSSRGKQVVPQGVIDLDGAIEYVAPQEYMAKGDALTKVEEAIKGTLHRHFMLDVDPEAAMEEFGTNPDIDDKPLPTLEESLDRAKRKLVSQDGIDEKAWEEAVQDVKERAPQLESLIETYTGPQQKSGKKKNEELHKIVKGLPPFASPELAAFAKRAMVTLQNNPDWSHGNKTKLLKRLVADARQLHESGAS